MRRPRAAYQWLAGLSMSFGRGLAIAWRFGRRLAGRLAVLGPLAPLRRRVARLPPLAALPLFLVPEACSRCGTLVSAWLLVQGDAWRALAVYVGSKLVVGVTALWIYTACQPALMRIRLFAAMHGALAALRTECLARCRAWATRASGEASRHASDGRPPTRGRGTIG